MGFQKLNDVYRFFAIGLFKFLFGKLLSPRCQFLFQKYIIQVLFIDFFIKDLVCGLKHFIVIIIFAQLVQYFL